MNNSHLNRFLLVTMFGFISAVAVCQEVDPRSAEESATRVRREYLQQLAHQYSLASSSQEETFTLTEDALLFYSNPTKALGSTHGASFLWLDGKRPVAACSFSIRRPNDSVGLEFSSFVDAALECRRDGELIWNPRTWNSEPAKISGAPEPAAQATRRLVQMRAVARQFRSTCYDRRSGEPTELRLLPQPLYRYEDVNSGVVDGAVFAYVISNDPELLLRLEAIESNGTRVWQGSFARMTSRQLAVTTEKTAIWEVANYYDGVRSSNRPYLEAGAEGREGLEEFQRSQSQSADIR
ncbi:hypothetical protein Enr13x_63880 [Stieleria neptunia]|uniref:Uncharacterized protein n=1 Tax=Stieleria neptunia TaxID=2527979 RepID=A0A518I041_9BACT|nr:hypothetical protein [Stieleria neptunia]QDV46479.1 hypothetical protein Enr13x_63880 [Stieleria neptunia]